MQVRKRIKVELEGSVFYFKPLTMKEATDRQQLMKGIDEGAPMIDMAKSVTELVLGWENVTNDDNEAIPFSQEVLLNEFTIFQLVNLITAYMKAIGWTGEEGSLPNVSEGSSKE